MKCRVFKKLDGRVIYSWPSQKYQNDFSKSKFPPETNGLLFIDLDESELPSEKDRDWYSHGPLIFDGECKKENLKFDEKWEVCLMSCDIIKRKYIARIGKKIDAELEKPFLDQIQLMQWQREKEKCKDWTDKEWYQKALENLDDDGLDKPLIREKLKAKINEL